MPQFGCPLKYKDGHQTNGCNKGKRQTDRAPGAEYGLPGTRKIFTIGE